MQSLFSIDKRWILGGVFIALSMGVVGCALTPPVLEMALADAAIRQAKDVGVETKQPTLYAQAHEAYQKAQYYHRQQNYAQARAYAIKARQLVEKAELSVVEETGLVSKEAQVVRAGVHDEGTKSNGSSEEKKDDPFEAY